MKQEKTEEKNVEEINNIQSKQLIKQLDKKSSKKIFINIIIAILLMAYFCVIAIVYNNVHQEGIISVVKGATLVFLGMTLVLIEIAYNKESKTLAIHAIEMLALAVHSLSTMHVVKMYNFDFKNYISVSSYIFAIYFVLKTIIINTKVRKEYLKEMSDISDIIKKDEPKKKEAVKKERNEEIEETAKQAEIQEDVRNEEETGKNKNKKLTEIRAKLKELQKQDNEKKKEKIEKENKDKKEQNADNKVEEETTPPKRKRGRPRKVQTQDNTENAKKKEDKQQEKTESKEENSTPPKRKRGRPKKEVKIND